MCSSSISKQCRLKKKRDFIALFQTGSRFNGKHFYLHVSKTQNARNRVAFSVGKKIGNAVCRNRVKRRLREAYRRNAMPSKDGLDLLFIAKAAILTARNSDIESEMGRLLGEIERT